MMDPRNPRPFATSAGPAGSSGNSPSLGSSPSLGNSPNSGEHLDDVAAMMLADGEAPPGATAHATGCAFCAGRIAAFRAEAAALAASLALDADELAFLQAALVPARVTAWAAAPPFTRPLARRWETPGLLLATLAVATAGAIGWQTATGLLATGVETARVAGATAVVANVVVGWAVALVQLLWQATVAIGQLPAIDAPAVPLLVLALMLWTALALAPRLAPARAEAV